MVVPTNPTFPGRGGTPLEPQAFYVELPVGATPDYGKLFRGIWRTLPDAYYAYQRGSPDLYSWTFFNPNFYPPTIPVIKRPIWRSLPDQPPQPLLQQAVFQSWIALYGVVARPKNQYDWPVPTTPAWRLDQTWYWSYNKNLIGQDQLPAGEQNYDLVPSQRAPEQIQLHSWSFTYNLNLIGRDRLPTGARIVDLAPSQIPPPPENLRRWEWKYNQNLIGRDQLPSGEQTYDLVPSQRPPEQIQLHTWQWSYNLSLIGQDRLAAGEIVYELPPRAYQQPAPSWTSSYNLNLVGQDQMVAGEQRLELPSQPVFHVQLRTWTWTATFYYLVTDQPKNQYSWPLTPAPAPIDQTIVASYNKNLIGQDRMAVGVQVYDLTQGQKPPWPLALQSWIWSYNLNLIGKDKLPFRQQDWPVPPPVQWYRSYEEFQLEELELAVPFKQLDWPLPGQPYRLEQTVTTAYNKNLIGQDQLPNRQSDWPNPIAPYRIDQTYAASYNKNLLGQDRMAAGAQTTDLPPRDFVRLFQTWIQAANLALVTAPPDLTKQARQQDWPNPRGAEPDWRRSFEGSFNKNLIGKDQLPIRQTDWPNPLSALAVREWVTSVNLALTAAQKPFAQYDWPLTPAAAQPERTAAASYNKNLIGQDRLPAGSIVTELPPRDFGRVLQDWIQSTNLSLKSIRPFAQSDWPLTPAAAQPERSVAASYNPNLVGRDRLPSGAIVSELPPRDFARALQTWIASVSLALTTAPPDLTKQARQQDWPNPIGFPDWAFRVGFTASLNLPLNGIITPPQPPTELPGTGGPGRWYDHYRPWCRDIECRLEELKAERDRRRRRHDLVAIERAVKTAIAEMPLEARFALAPEIGAIGEQLEAVAADISPELEKRIAETFAIIAQEIDDEEAFLLLQQ